MQTGCGAVWLARLTGGQKVAGSNPVSPIFFLLLFCANLTELLLGELSTDFLLDARRFLSACWHRDIS